MRLRWLYFGLSLVVVIPGIVSLVRFGLKPAIDFTGGSLVELVVGGEGRETSEAIQQISKQVGINVERIQVERNTIRLRTEAMGQDKLELLKTGMREKMGEVEERRFETVGPTIGKELLIKTVTAVIVAAGAILVYVAYRFKSFKFGVCAVVAMLHDTIVVVGSFSLLGKLAGVEVDTLFVTAVLTILSFSVHDTIVVYDRIRESVKLYPKADFEAVVDYAVTTTLSRSINNSMTIIFTLLALFLLGGETIRWFILALLIGTVSGTYSSTFTAAPLLVVWEKVASKRLKQR